MKTKRIIPVLAFLLFLVLSGCESAAFPEEVASFAEMRDLEFCLGYSETDDVDAELSELFPNASLENYSDVLLGLDALMNGKIDAYSVGRPFLERGIDEGGFTGIRILDENVKVFQCALGLSQLSSVPDFADRVNACLSQLEADGVLDDMRTRWLEETSDAMPEITMPSNPDCILQVATYGGTKPYSYIQNNELIGFDVELAYRVAAALNCGIELVTADYPAMLLGLSEGKYDMVSANLYLTEERSENILFSEPYNETEIAVAVREKSNPETVTESYSQLSDFENKSAVIGMPSDINAEAYVYEICPNATIVYYDTVMLGYDALISGKLDGYVAGENYFEEPLRQNLLPGTKMLDDAVVSYQCALGLSDECNIEEFEERVNACITELEENGTLEDMIHRWYDGTDETLPQIAMPSNPEATLKVVTFGECPPYSYLKDNELVGFDVELAYRVAAYLNCDLTIETASYPSMLMGLSMGKYDMIASNLYISEERTENITYSIPYNSSEVKMLVAEKTDTETEISFFTQLKNGLYRTFVAESRWKMVLSGLGTTLLITVLGFLLANLFGALFCALAIKGGRAGRILEDIYSRIMQGTPIVVVLMILFYIIFAKSSISGIWIAVLGFGLSSGASLAQQFQGAIQGIPKEQTEAGLALGFTGYQTFCGIVFPQALRTLLPGYFSELIALMKGTSIVGYVAVVDLTKSSDLIRSSTYDAFFPLISIAVIYFVIAFFLLGFLKRLQKKLAPKRVRKAGDPS